MNEPQHCSTRGNLRRQGWPDVNFASCSSGSHREIGHLELPTLAAGIRFKSCSCSSREEFIFSAAEFCSPLLKLLGCSLPGGRGAKCLHEINNKLAWFENRSEIRNFEAKIIKTNMPCCTYCTYSRNFPYL